MTFSIFCRRSLVHNQSQTEEKYGFCICCSSCSCRCMGLFELTRLSNTHLFNFHSAGLHCQSCWLLLSKHCQCLRNCSKQCLLTSSMLNSPISTCFRIFPYLPHIGYPALHFGLGLRTYPMPRRSPAVPLVAV